MIQKVLARLGQQRHKSVPGDVDLGDHFRAAFASRRPVTFEVAGQLVRVRPVDLPGRAEVIAGVLGERLLLIGARERVECRPIPGRKLLLLCRHRRVAADRLIAREHALVRLGGAVEVGRVLAVAVYEALPKPLVHSGEQILHRDHLHHALDLGARHQAQGHVRHDAK